MRKRVSKVVRASRDLPTRGLLTSRAAHWPVARGAEECGVHGESPQYFRKYRICQRQTTFSSRLVFQRGSLAIDVLDLFDISGINGHLSWSLQRIPTRKVRWNALDDNQTVASLALVRLELAPTHVHLVKINETSEWKAYIVLWYGLKCKGSD